MMDDIPARVYIYNDQQLRLEIRKRIDWDDDSSFRGKPYLTPEEAAIVVDYVNEIVSDKI